MINAICPKRCVPDIYQDGVKDYFRNFPTKKNYFKN